MIVDETNYDQVKNLPGFQKFLRELNQTKLDVVRMFAEKNTDTNVAMQALAMLIHDSMHMAKRNNPEQYNTFKHYFLVEFRQMMEQCFSDDTKCVTHEEKDGLPFFRIN